MSAIQEKRIYTRSEIESVIEQLTSITLDGTPFFEIQPLIEQEEDEDEIYVLVNVVGNTSGVHSGVICFPCSITKS